MYIKWKRYMFKNIYGLICVHIIHRIFANSVPWTIYAMYELVDVNLVQMIYVNNMQLFDYIEFESPYKATQKAAAEYLGKHNCKYSKTMTVAIYSFISNINFIHI